MAWTDVSSEVGNGAGWGTFGSSSTNTNRWVMDDVSVFTGDAVWRTNPTGWSVGSLDQYNTGMDGYAPATPDPIANNIDQGGGGGSVRPSSGFLYPRGDS